VVMMRGFAGIAVGALLQQHTLRALRPSHQVCYSYGNIRDDHAAFHYGFMPPLESPPRLLAVSRS